MRAGRVGIQPHGRPQVADSGLGLPQREERGGQVDVGRHVLRLESQRLSIPARRVGEAPLVPQRTPDAVEQLGVLRVLRQQVLVVRRLQDGPIVVAAQADLKLQVRHLVGRPIAGGDPARRVARLARVVGRVVERPAHPHRGAPRQGDGIPVAIDVLPPEVPLVDADQRPRGPVGERGPTLEPAAQVVGVGIDHEHFDVDRQLHRVGHLEGGLARRDVELLVGIQDDDVGRIAGLAGLGEVEADLALHGLRGVGRQQVELQHEVGPGLEPPRHSVDAGERQHAGCPAQQAAVRHVGPTHAHPAESRPRVVGVEAPRGAHLVDAQQRVVDETGAAGAQLDRPHVARLGAGDGNHEVPEDVGIAGRQRVRLRHADDEVGLTELPPVRGARSRRQVVRIALRHPLPHPAAEGVDLLVREDAGPGEVAVPRCREPGRHDPATGCVDDAGAVGSYAGVVEHAERRRALRVMAAGALVEEDRGDVPRIRGA